MVRHRRNKQKSGHYIDYSLIFIVLFLLGFGLIMVYSASSYEASTSSALGNDPAFYLKKQIFASCVGLVFMTGFAIYPYQRWKKWDVAGYLISALLILLVLTPLGYEANGARRWLKVGVSVQPDEIAKLAMILFLASLMCNIGKGINTRRGFLTVLLSPVPICLMVWKITENMSSAIIIFGIAFLMLYVASPKYKDFVGFAVAAVLAVGGIVFLLTSIEDVSSFGFRGARVLAWLDPEAYASGKGYQHSVFIDGQIAQLCAAILLPAHRAECELFQLGRRQNVSGP